MLMKKVLIATGFSTAAEGLLNCIEEFKQMGMEEALLVHVIDIRVGEGLITSLQQSAQKRLGEMAEKLIANGIKSKTSTPIGFAATEIVQIAKNEDVSLILISSRGRGVIKEVLLGSTTFDVIRLSGVPVMVEKYRRNDAIQIDNMGINKFQKVLVPLDFSECSTIILDKIKEMAALIQEIILLSVVERAESKEELMETKEKVKAQLDMLVAELTDIGLQVKGVVGVGRPSRCIVELADDEEATSIIMGTRGSGLIKSLLLGSTSDTVARTSKKAVILIPCSR